MKTFTQFISEAKAVHTHEAEECPKCERELGSDGYCDHCDHYVDKEGRVSYPEDRE